MRVLLRPFLYVFLLNAFPPVISRFIGQGNSLTSFRCFFSSNDAPIEPCYDATRYGIQLNDSIIDRNQWMSGVAGGKRDDEENVREKNVPKLEMDVLMMTSRHLYIIGYTYATDRAASRAVTLFPTALSRPYLLFVSRAATHLLLLRGVMLVWLTLARVRMA